MSPSGCSSSPGPKRPIPDDGATGEQADSLGSCRERWVHGIPATCRSRRYPCHLRSYIELRADGPANLRELMERMGHSTTRAATVYLHGGTERQHAIADELSRQAAEQLGRSKAKRSGTQRARRRRTAS